MPWFSLALLVASPKGRELGQATSVVIKAGCAPVSLHLPSSHLPLGEDFLHPRGTVLLRVNTFVDSSSRPEIIFSSFFLFFFFLEKAGVFLFTEVSPRKEKEESTSRG